MKKTIIYVVIIIVCIGFCYLFSSIGIKAEGKGNVNPWAFTIGILAIAVIMALVHKIAEKHDNNHPDDDPQDKES